VSDDGRGIDRDHAPHGDGLDNLRARAARRSGNVSIGDRTGGGTSLVWTVPLGT